MAGFEGMVWVNVKQGSHEVASLFVMMYEFVFGNLVYQSDVINP